MKILNANCSKCCKGLYINPKDVLCSDCQLNIYLIWQNVNDDYETYDSAIVVAKSKKDAKSIHPSKTYNICHEKWNGKHEEYGSWCDINDVKVKLIGKATASQKRGVICASYNAG